MAIAPSLPNDRAARRALPSIRAAKSRGASVLEIALALAFVLTVVAAIRFYLLPAMTAASQREGETLASLAAGQSLHPADGQPVACTGGNCKGGASCFVAGTPIETPDGPRPIEEIRAGDEVVSFDEESGERAIRRVTATFVTRERSVLDVRLGGQASPIRATPGHRFFTRDRGWVSAESLQVGEPLVDAEGNDVFVDGVEGPVGRDTVFNFEVEDTHTYFAGDARVLVHNPVHHRTQAGADGGVLEWDEVQVTVAQPQVAIVQLSNDGPFRAAVDGATDAYARAYPNARRLGYEDLRRPEALRGIQVVIIVTHGMPGYVLWGNGRARERIPGWKLASRLQRAGFRPDPSIGEVHVMACNSATKPQFVRLPFLRNDSSVSQDVADVLGIQASGARANYRKEAVLQGRFPFLRQLTPHPHAGQSETIVLPSGRTLELIDQGQLQMCQPTAPRP